VSLKPINNGRLKTIAGNLKPFQAVTKHLDDEAILRAKYSKHQYQMETRTRNAAKALARLPEPGEVFTILMRGNFSGFDFVPAALKLASPATITELVLATYGFSQRNAGQIIDLIDRGQVKKVWMICSTFTTAADSDIYEAFRKVLTERGSQIAPARNHAKLIGMKFDDGRHYVVDGSINMRSARMTEQAHVWADEDLYDMYANYIKGFHERPEAKTETK
jgi:hypothetical protein